MLNGESSPESRSGLVTCAAHGLHFDPRTSAGCVLCRKASEAPAAPAAGSGRALLLIGAVFGLSLAGLLAFRVHHAAPTPVSVLPSPRKASPETPDIDPVPGSDAREPASDKPTLTVQTFGVPTELIPTFHDAPLPPWPSPQPPKDFDHPVELLARVKAEHTRCEGGSNEACVEQALDCVGATTRGSTWVNHPTSHAQEDLLRRLRGPDGPALRAELARGGGKLPPSDVLAAMELDLVHEQEHRAAEAGLFDACVIQPIEDRIVKACTDGSLRACELLLDGPTLRVPLDRACDVGSRRACVGLIGSFGDATVSGETARLRALELERCPPGSSCLARSRNELRPIARDTLRAGISRTCVEGSVSLCRELAIRFSRPTCDPEMVAMVRSLACQRGERYYCPR